MAFASYLSPSARPPAPPARLSARPSAREGLALWAGRGWARAKNTYVAQHHFDQLPKRKRQGILPDMMATCRQGPGEPARAILIEFKTLHHGATTYPDTDQRCGAVAQRASRIGAEYLRKARTLDRTWLGTAPNQQGPVELHLRGHGAVRGVVFGSWSEASGDVDWLLSEAVAVGLSGRRHFRPSDDDA